MTRLLLHTDLESLDVPERPDEIALATLTTYDIPALAMLQLVAYDQPETAQSLLDTSDQMRMAFDGAFGTPRDDSFVGAWCEGELVGAVLVVLDSPWDDAPRGPFVTELMVDPAFRRQGVATALIGEVGARAAQWGYDSLALRLDLRQSNGAIDLYQSLGFSVIEDNGDDD